MRTAGVVALIGLLCVLGASTVVSLVRSPRAARPDVTGIIQLYGDGTIVVETMTAGLRAVRIDPLTVVRDMERPRAGPDDGLAGAPAGLADLRPGRPAIVWVDVGWSALPVAREIGVWGKAR